MNSSILYCGDTSLNGAAAYLAGLLTRWGCAFDYVPSDQSVSATDIEGRSLVILSDFPASGMRAEAESALLDAVKSGTGLLMIGGWESFHGVGGDWETSTVASALPIVMQSTDDRLNCDHPVLIRQVASHSAIDGLPWAERPPVIGGFNRFQAKPDGTVVLEADRIPMRYADGNWKMQLVESHPLLVFGRHGKGLTAALATDAAPHWVGGFVDWGDGRVRARATGAEEVEVGDLYAQFWWQLISFLSGQEISPPDVTSH